MTFLRITSMQAREGDCLVLSYGADETSVRHLVIDAGRAATAAKLLDYLRAKGVERIEALVVTHVDADHIEGVLDFVRLAEGEVEIADVWFNGWKHLREDLQDMGPGQGETLTQLLSGRNWNRIADGGAIRTDDDGTPRVLPALDGGLRLTVLSPDAVKLAAMRKTWAKACAQAGLIPGEPPPAEPAPTILQRMGGSSIEQLAMTVTGKDTTKANGTSIALLAEFDGTSILLGADAHPDILARGIRHLGQDDPLHIDLFKIPHHGSQANVTRELLAAVECGRFLISTDGSRFGHPDPVAVARIVASRKAGTELYFNYRQDRTTAWDERVEGRDRYACFFPEEGDGFIEVILRGGDPASD